MTTRGEINSNFYQIVNVDSNGAPTSVKPEYLPNVANANYAANAGHANVADTANSVSVGNVVGIGNIATINLNGNGSQLLAGNGAWVAQGTTSNANYANFAGTAFSVSAGNITGVVNLANYATVANSVAGSNVSGYVPNATHANISDSADSVAVANVTGIGNIATVNLTGSTANVLYGNGTFAAIPTVSNVANANYSNFAGTAYSVSAGNIVGTVNLANFATTANSVAGSNVSGQVANANYSNYSNIANTANSVAVANVSGIGNIATVNLDGNVSNVLSGTGTWISTGTAVTANFANYAGNVTVSSQPNITSVGTLTDLTVAGNITTSRELVGPNTSANFTRFPNTTVVISNVAAGIQQNEPGTNGLVSEAVANPADTSNRGVGVYGVGYTSGGASADGIDGEGHVSDPSDTGSATGVRGYSFDTHPSGVNIGLYAAALNGGNNYALYMKHGNILSYDPQTWTVVDDNASALSVDSTGKTGILDVVTTNGSEGVKMSGYANVAGNLTSANASLGNLATANYFSGNGSLLTSITGGNVTGIVANANFASYSNVSNTANSVAVANVSGIGNIATVNLTGSTSNVLYGNGVFAEIPTVSNVANANYANYAGNAFSVSGANVSGEVANANFASYSNVSNTANSVAVANVSGIGNIATVNLTGSTSNVLYGNGVFAAIPTVSNVANANYANFAGNAFSVDAANIVGTVNLANYATVANSVAGANVTGTVANANFASYSNVSNSANSVAVANVSGIGNIATINLTGSTSNVLYGNGVFAAPVVAAAGSNTQIQYNNNGVIGASANFYYQDDNKLLIIGDTSTGGNGIIKAASVRAYDFRNQNNYIAFTTDDPVTGSNANVTFGGIVSFNSNSNVKITGGSSGQVLTTDGTGNLSWAAATSTNANYANYAGNAFSVDAANIVGTVNLANYATVANSVAVANVSGIGNIATVNLTGSTSNVLYGNGVFAAIPATATANFANFAGNVTVAAQPNITSLGQLTSLVVSNAVFATRFVSNIATGTAPLTVTSTTLVGNLFVEKANTVAGVLDTTTAADFGVAFFGNASNTVRYDNTTFTYNPQTGNVVSTGFVGRLYGNANAATNANAVLSNTSTSTTAYITFTTSSANGFTGLVKDTGLTANLSNNSITAATFVGELVGNATAATSATNANAVLSNTSVTSTVYPMFTSSSANGFVGTLKSTGISANLSNSSITATTFVGNLNGNVPVANVSGIGNIATINLTGSTSNVLYGNGVFAAISATNANYANYAGNAFSVDAANIVGTVNLANYATVANSVAVGNVSGIGNIATINLDGNSSNLLYGNGSFAPISITSVANANYANFAGDVVNASQSNITSVGTLTSLTVSGTANMAGGNLVATTSNVRINSTENTNGITISTGALQVVGGVGIGANLFVYNTTFSNNISMTGAASNIAFQSGGAYINTLDLKIPGTANIGNLTANTTINLSGNTSAANLSLVKYYETLPASANTSTSIAPNLASGTIVRYTANANFSFNGFTSAVAGQSGTVIITQDATGGRTMTSTMKFAGNSKTLSTAASSIDIICVFYDGTTYYATLSKGYA